MATETDICNEALGKIGARDTIASLAEDSNEAEKCNLFYANTRDEILQMADWGFAKAIIPLTLFKQAPGTPGGDTSATEWSDEYPSPPWLYSYEYPDTEDFLNVRAIVPMLNDYSYPYLLAQAAGFEIGSDVDDADEVVQVVLTNQASALAWATRRVTNTLLFSPLFRSALSYALAAKLAAPLTGDKELAKLMFAFANEAVGQARENAANQGLTVINQEAEWILAREGGTIQFSGSNIAPYAPLYLL